MQLAAHQQLSHHQQDSWLALLKRIDDLDDIGLAAAITTANLAYPAIRAQFIDATLTEEAQPTLLTSASGAAAVPRVLPQP